MKLYKSYSFKDKDPIVDRIRTIRDGLGWNNTRLAEESGVSLGCIWRQLDGPTKRPQHATVAAQLGAMGYHFEIVPRRTATVIPLKLRKRTAG